MDETELFPSPNWFHQTCMAVTTDGWIIYGGPTRTLCVLEPLPDSYETIIAEKNYKAHVINKATATSQKIVSVDISPEWPKKRLIITGSADGAVRLWSLAHDEDNVLRVKTLQVHDVHTKDNEEIAGVGYSTEEYAISVGCYGNLVKWNLNTNVVTNHSQFLKKFRPSCMSCSRHAPLQVAVGTKQGLLFLLDLNGKGKVLYKVRAHDDEMLHLSWCPQYEVIVKKQLMDVAQSRMSKLRKALDAEAEIENKDEVLSFKTNESTGLKKTDKQTPKTEKAEHSEEEIEEEDMFDMYKDHEDNEFGHKKFQATDVYVKVKAQAKENDFLAECLKLKYEILKRKSEPEPSIESLVQKLDETHVDEKVDKNVPSENGSGDSAKDNEADVTEESGHSSSHVHRHLLATISKHGTVRIWSKTGKQVSSCQVSQVSNKLQNKPKGSGFWLSLLWYRPDALLISDLKSQLLVCNPLNMDCKLKLEWSVLHSAHKRNLYGIATTAPRVQTPTTEVEDWPIFTVAQDRAVIQYSLKEKKIGRSHATCGGFVYSIATCPYDPKKIAISVGDGAVRVWELDTTDDDTRLSSQHVTTYWQHVQGKVLTVAWHPTRENRLAFGTAESRVGIIDTSGRQERPAKTLPGALSGGVYSLCWGGGALLASAGGQLAKYTDKSDQAPEIIDIVVEGAKWKVCEVYWSERALLVGSEDGGVAAVTSRAPHVAVAAAFPFNKLIHCIDWHPQQVSESNEESPLKNLIAVSSLDKQNAIAILELSEKEDGDIGLSSWKKLTGHKGAVLRVAWNPHRDGILLSSSQDCTVRVWDVVQGVCTSIFGGHSASALSAAWLAAPALAAAALSGGGDCCLRVFRTSDHPADMYDDVSTSIFGGHSASALSAAWLAAPALAAAALSGGGDCCLRVFRTSDHPADMYDESKHEDAIAIAKIKTKKNKKATDAPKAATLEDENPQEDTTKVIVKETSQKDEDHTSHDEEEVAIVANASKDKKSKPSSKFLVSYQNKYSTHSLQACRKLLSRIKNKDEKVSDTDDCEIKFVKMFGSTNEVNELLDEEAERHISFKNHESWIMLSIFRGNMDKVFEYASEKDMICPFLLSIAPCVSFKYWKDITQLYLAQLDRLIAKGDDSKLNAQKSYGGAVYRKVAVLLAVHDARAAVSELRMRGMYTEAYLLARTRYMDSIAEETLQEWAQCMRQNGVSSTAALLYLALGDLDSAASTLSRCTDEEQLSLAAEIAKTSGQTTLSNHIIEKVKMNATAAPSVDELAELPSRLECLIMKEKSERAEAVEGS